MRNEAVGRTVILQCKFYVFLHRTLYYNYKIYTNKMYLL